MINNLRQKREIKDYANEDAFNVKMKTDVIKPFLEFSLWLMFSPYYNCSSLRAFATQSPSSLNILNETLSRFSASLRAIERVKARLVLDLNVSS